MSCCLGLRSLHEGTPDCHGISLPCGGQSDGREEALCCLSPMTAGMRWDWLCTSAILSYFVVQLALGGINRNIWTLEIVVPEILMQMGS